MAGAAFANDKKTETISEVITPKIEVLQVKQTVQKETKKVKCFSFNSSCGDSFDVCHAGSSIWDILDALWVGITTIARIIKVGV
jgi:hypothetical protein